MMLIKKLIPQLKDVATLTESIRSKMLPGKVRQRGPQQGTRGRGTIPLLCSLTAESVLESATEQSDIQLLIQTNGQ